MKVSTEIDNNFGHEKITQLVDNIPLIHTIYYTYMYISNDSNIILKYYRFYTLHAQERTTFVNSFSSSMIMRFTQINNMNRAIFIYSLVTVFQLLTVF
jgi:hypothetical protein